MILEVYLVAEEVSVVNTIEYNGVSIGNATDFGDLNVSTTEKEVPLATRGIFAGFR